MSDATAGNGTDIASLLHVTGTLSCGRRVCISSRRRRTESSMSGKRSRRRSGFPTPVRLPSNRCSRTTSRRFALLRLRTRCGGTQLRGSRSRGNRAGLDGTRRCHRQVHAPRVPRREAEPGLVGPSVGRPDAVIPKTLSGYAVARPRCSCLQPFEARKSQRSQRHVRSPLNPHCGGAHSPGRTSSHDHFAGRDAAALAPAPPWRRQPHGTSRAATHSRRVPPSA